MLPIPEADKTLVKTQTSSVVMRTKSDISVIITITGLIPLLVDYYSPNVIVNKTKVLLPQASVTIADFGYPFRPFGFNAPKTSFDFERT